jgi:hypothetical protein
MELLLRPTVIGGDKLTDDYCVFHDGRRIGRIRLATEREGSQGTVYDWMVNIPIAIPPGCRGTSGSLDEAKKNFKTAWERFLPTLTEDKVKHWHETQDAAEARWMK